MNKIIKHNLYLNHSKKINFYTTLNINCVAVSANIINEEHAVGHTSYKVKLAPCDHNKTESE